MTLSQNGDDDSQARFSDIRNINRMSLGRLTEKQQGGSELFSQNGVGVWNCVNAIQL